MGFEFITRLPQKITLSRQRERVGVRVERTGFPLTFTLLDKFAIVPVVQKTVLSNRVPPLPRRGEEVSLRVIFQAISDHFFFSV